MGSVDEGDWLDLQRALAAAGGWGWRLATRRARAARHKTSLPPAAALVAHRGAFSASPSAASLSSPSTVDGPLQRPALLCLVEQVVRSPAYAERVAELLLGAAGAAATQRDRYGDGGRPGPLDVPVGFGLPWT